MRQEQIITGAIQKTKEEKERILTEREQYQKELEERLRKQEEELNPMKYESQKSFIEQMKNQSVSGQVQKNREDLQRGRTHLTPQGIIQSYDDDTTNNK
jgi:hypothetical protein